MPAEPFPLSPSRGPDPFPVPLRLRVLVVDDNRDGADTTAVLLRACGAEAEARYGGAAALAALPDFRPDACVIDLAMPGVDGCDLARRIRAATGENPPLFVALTAHGDAVTRARAAESGFDFHFVKPVDPAELLHALGEHAARTTRETVPDLNLPSDTPGGS
jgi:two-component system, OmpR family, response regulator